MGKGTRNRTRRNKGKTEEKTEVIELKNGISTSSYFSIKWLAVLFTFLGTFVFTFYEPLSIPDNIFYYGQTLQKIGYALFCYLCAESFWHTKNRLRHFIILMSIALAFELPYDQIVYGKLFSPEKQNPVFGIAIGFLALCLTHIDYKNAFIKIGMKYKSAKANQKWARLICLFLCGSLLSFLYVEYSWHSVFLIFIFGIARNRKHRGLLQTIGIISFSIFTSGIVYLSYACVLALIPISIAQCRERYPKYFVTTKFTKLLNRIFESKVSAIASRLFCLITIIVFAVARTYFIK